MQAVHQSPGWGLRQDAGDAADRECDSNALLVPAVAGQVDREKRSDFGLDVRQQESASEAAARAAFAALMTRPL
jgi:hypothetical protein